jgi:hypothetical protein
LIRKLINTSHIDILMRHFINRKNFIDGVRYSILKDDIKLLQFFMRQECLVYLLETDYKIIKSINNLF